MICKRVVALLNEIVFAKTERPSIYKQLQIVQGPPHNGVRSDVVFHRSSYKRTQYALNYGNSSQNRLHSYKKGFHFGDYPFKRVSRK